MKKEDIEKLRKLCESNGYYFDFDVISDTAVVAKPKDIWEGVEFVYSLVHSKIFKVLSIRDYVIDVSNSIALDKEFCKPSTEQAYIEQLKKEAKNKYGENYLNVVFDWSMMNGGSIQYTFNWQYIKDTDTLYFLGRPIYQKGKWAKKIEKAEVNIKDWGWKKQSNNSIDFDFKFNIPNGGNNIIVGMLAEYLAKQLEDYLNKKE